MRVVYTADTVTQAYLIRGLLEQAGIEAHIEGEFLQGAMGELPAFGLVRVLVADAKASSANRLIEEYESAEPLDEGSAPT